MGYYYGEIQTMKKLMNRLICGTALMIMITLLVAGDVCAVNHSWTGSGGDNNWSTATNWDGGVNIPANGDTVIFDFNSTSRHDTICDYNLTGIKIEVIDPLLQYPFR